MKDDGYSRWWARLTGALLAAVVSMTTLEFVEVQKLSSDDLRAPLVVRSGADRQVSLSLVQVQHGERFRHRQLDSRSNRRRT